MPGRPANATPQDEAARQAKARFVDNEATKRALNEAAGKGDEQVEVLLKGMGLREERVDPAVAVRVAHVVHAEVARVVNKAMTDAPVTLTCSGWEGQVEGCARFGLVAAPGACAERRDDARGAARAPSTPHVLQLAASWKAVPQKSRETFRKSINGYVASLARGAHGDGAKAMAMAVYSAHALAEKLPGVDVAGGSVGKFLKGQAAQAIKAKSLIHVDANSIGPTLIMLTATLPGRTRKRRCGGGAHRVLYIFCTSTSYMKIEMEPDDIVLMNGVYPHIAANTTRVAERDVVVVLYNDLLNARGGTEPRAHGMPLGSVREWRVPDVLKSVVTKHQPVSDVVGAPLGIRVKKRQPSDGAGVSASHGTLIHAHFSTKQNAWLGWVEWDDDGDKLEKLIELETTDRKRVWEQFVEQASKVWD